MKFPIIKKQRQELFLSKVFLYSFLQVGLKNSFDKIKEGIYF